MKRAHQLAAVPNVARRDRRPSSAAFGGVLALQRGAGNRAVAGLLARDAKTAERKETRVAVVPGIGEIPIEGLQLPTNRTGGTSKGHDDPPKEVVLSSKVGRHSTALWRESLNGQAKDIEVILSGPHGTLRIKLKRALIAGYQMSDSGGDPMETWTLNAESIEFVTEKGEETPEPPAWFKDRERG